MRALFGTVWLAGCIDDPALGPQRSAPAAASVTVTPAGMTLARGAAGQLTALTRDGDGEPLAGRRVTWGSSDHTVAHVSATGLHGHGHRG